VKLEAWNETLSMWKCSRKLVSKLGYLCLWSSARCWLTRCFQKKFPWKVNCSDRTKIPARRLFGYHGNLFNLGITVVKASPRSTLPTWPEGHRSKANHRLQNLISSSPGDARAKGYGRLFTIVVRLLLQNL
jgi:hypothetical protein